MRVTDQEGTIVEAVWAIAVDDTQFVFINSATGTSGVGTIGDPLKLFTDWFEGDMARDIENFDRIEVLDANVRVIANIRVR